MWCVTQCNMVTGYCGADMKALCTEAALHALRRRYPQIYNSEDKLQLDVASINVSAKDFYRAMQDIVPTAQRSTASPGRALSRAIEPLLQSGLNRILETLHRNFPRALSRYSSIDSPPSKIPSFVICWFMLPIKKWFSPKTIKMLCDWWLFQLCNSIYEYWIIKKAVLKIQYCAMWTVCSECYVTRRYMSYRVIKLW